MWMLYSFAGGLIASVTSLSYRNCPNETFRCGDGMTCIRNGKFCDGYEDCSDGSDEITSIAAENWGYRACFGMTTDSRGSHRLCQLKRQFFCDSKPICADAADERFCGKRFSDHFDNVWFRCFGYPGAIVPIIKVCDGKFDCPDLTDECLCQSSARPKICERLEWEGQKPYLRCKESNNSKRVDVIAAQVCNKTSDCSFVENLKHCEDEGLSSPFCRITEPVGMRACDYATRHSKSFATCLRDLVHCKAFMDEQPSLKYPEFAEYMLKDFNTDSSRPWITCSAAYFDLMSMCSIGYSCSTASYQSVSRIKECRIPDVNVTDGFGIEVPCNCTYFKCHDELDQKYILGNAVCDGFKDCTSGIDECQPGCIVSAFSDEKSMITNKGVMVLVWIFSVIAIIGCTSVVASTLHGIVTSFGLPANSPQSNINKLLIMSLSISDLLVGIYTMSICIKAVEVEGRYCEVDTEWRTSTTCSILGALFIIGSEQSVMTLVMITNFRLNAVKRPFARPKLKQAIVALVISWFISILIGIIPIMPSFEDYFLKDVSFNDTVIFKTKVNRNERQHLVNWLGFLDLIHENGDRSEWGKLERMISKINRYSPIKSTHKFGYYSSHTVCLPAFFPDRYKDGSWMYSFLLLMFNFLAFLFMLVSYIALYRKATNKRILESSTARNKRDEQSAAMQRKLTRILATDFLYWMPVCIMGFMQLSGMEIPLDAYLPSGLLILPINSALNPFLYSNLPDIMNSRGRRFITYLGQSLRRWRNTGSSPEVHPAQSEALELNVIPVPEATS